MSIVWLLCAVAFGASLTAKTLPNGSIVVEKTPAKPSLAETDARIRTHMANQMNDPKSQIADIKGEKKSVETQLKTDLSAIKRDASKRAADVEKSLSPQTNGVANSIEKLTEKAAEYRESAVEISNDIAAKIAKKHEELVEENVVIHTDGEATLNGIKNFATEQLAEWRTESNENLDGIKTEGKERMEEVSQTQAETLKEIKEDGEEQTESFVELDEEIKQTQGDDTETFGEETELADEIGEGVKETDEDTEEVSREENKEVLTVDKAAKGYIPTLESMAQRTRQAAGEAVKRATQDADTDLKDILKDAKREDKDLLAESEEKSDELVALEKDQIVDFKDLISEHQTTNSEVLLSAGTTQKDAESAYLQATDEERSLNTAAVSLGDEGQFALNRVIDSANAKLVSVEADVESGGETVQQSINAKTSELGDTVNTNLLQAVASVRTLVDQDISNLQGNVDKGSSMITTTIGSLESEAGTLGAQMASDNAQLDSFQDATKTLGDQIESTSKDVLANMEHSQESILKDINDIGSAADDKFRYAAQKVDDEASKADADTTKMAESVRTGLNNKIDGYRTDTITHLERSGRNIASATERGADVMRGMTETAQAIEKLKVEIVNDTPGAKQATEAALSLFSERLDSANEKLIEMKATSSSHLKAEEQKMEGDAMSAVDLADTQFRNRLMFTNRQLEEVTEQLGDKVTELKRSTFQDYDGAQHEQDAIKQVVGGAAHSVDVSNGISDQNFAELGKRLSMATAVAEDGVRKQVTDSEMLKKQSLAEFEMLRQDAVKNADNEVAAARETGRKEIAEFRSNGVKALKAAGERADGYITKNGADLEALTDNVKKMTAALDERETDANQKEKWAQDSIHSLGIHEKDLEARLKYAAMSDSTQITLKQGTLTGEAMSAVNAMQLTEENRMKEIQSAEEQKMSTERINGQVLFDNLMQDVAAITSNLHQGTDSTNEAVGGARDAMDGLAKAEAALELTLQRDAGGVGAAAEKGEDQVKQDEQVTESQMGASMDQNLKLMGDLLSGYDSTKGKQEEAMRQLGSEFKNKLGPLKGRGEAEAQELTRQIDLMVNNAPDFKRLFAEDTDDASGALHEMQSHLTGTSTWTKNVIDSYAKKLAAAKTQRVAEAHGIHSKTSELKRLVVNEAKKAIEEVDDIQKETAKMKDERIQSLREFGSKMGELSGTEVTHDDAIIDDVTTTLYGLMGTHTRLMSWKDGFKDRTDSWRGAVEDNLRKLGRGIGEENADESMNRLDNEMAVNDGLRTLQLRVQDEVAEQAAKKTKAFGDVADSMAAGMEALEAKSEENNKKTELKAEGLAKEQAKADLTGLEGLRTVAENQQELEQRNEELKVETAIGKEKMGAYMKLPLMAASDFNVQTHEKANAVKSEINQLGSSLIEESSKNNLRNNAENGAVLDEIKALTSLNAELNGDNSKLTGENKHLEDELDYVKELPL